jgi:hypothetical protein
LEKTHFWSRVIEKKTPNPVSNAIEATLQSASWVDETKQTSDDLPEQ